MEPGFWIPWWLALPLAALALIVAIPWFVARLVWELAVALRDGLREARAAR